MSAVGYFRPPVRSPLAQAAGGRSPFQFGSGLSGLFGSGAAAHGSPIITPPPHIPNRFTRPQVPSGAAIDALRNPSTVGHGGVNTSPTAAGNNVYDINTDPAYQQAQALVGLSNEQAAAAAQKQIKDLLVAYGDPALATQLGLGGDIAKAAGGNPNSTTAQLRTQRDRNLKNLEDQLNSANLSYSGYRVSQEKQAAQDYQNALAQAAAQVQAQIGQIQDQLNQAYQANNMQLYQAAQAAAANAPQYAPGPSGSASPSGSSLTDWLHFLVGGQPA